MDLARYTVPEDMSILDTMRVINDGARANAFICRDGRLLAVVTDGDIRRSIIKSGDLNQPISNIANYDPIFLYEKDRAKAEKLMRKMSITAVPVVDDGKMLLDLVFAVEKRSIVYPTLKVPVVIMAGGKGTRLKPYTEVLPKPLIPVGDRTITEHIMDRFERYGCTHFDMIVNHKKNFIMSYFRDHERKRDITFVEEPEFWGTAGGLRLLFGKYSAPFFVTNCDILVDADYEAILKAHKEQNNLITLVCARKKMTIPYGTIKKNEEGQILDLEEKPEFSFLTNTGLYVVEPDFLQRIPENTFIHITDLIKSGIRDGIRIGTFVIDEDQWMDMGQMEELERMKRHLELKGEW